MFDEFDVDKATRLGKAVHYSLDINKDTAVDIFWSDVIFFHDIIWNILDWYPYVFKIKHVCDEIKIVNVEADGLI